MEHIKDQFAKGTWLTYRPEIKIIDCTIRDGGLINDHQFDDGFVKAVYETCVAAGIDAMEFGYKADKKIFAPAQFGAWKFCDEDAIRRIVGDNPTDLKIAVMADAERTDYHTDILPKEKSIIDIVRVATYIHQIPTALDMIKDAHDKGYRVTVQPDGHLHRPGTGTGGGAGDPRRQPGLRASLSWTASAPTIPSKSAT